MKCFNRFFSFFTKEKKIEDTETLGEKTRREVSALFGEDNAPPCTECKHHRKDMAPLIRCANPRCMRRDPIDGETRLAFCDLARGLMGACVNGRLFEPESTGKE